MIIGDNGAVFTCNAGPALAYARLDRPRVEWHPSAPHDPIGNAIIEPLDRRMRVELPKEPPFTSDARLHVLFGRRQAAFDEVRPPARLTWKTRAEVAHTLARRETRCATRLISRRLPPFAPPRKPSRSDAAKS